MMGRMWLAAAAGYALAGAAAGAMGADLPAEVPDNDVLAYARLSDAPKPYRETPYHFLGDGDLRLAVAVAPRAGHVLELRWGAKNDERAAVLTLNGRAVPLSAGGYDGFRWLRVPVPAGVSGAGYELGLSAAGGGKPAFVAEVRLAAGTDAQARPLADLKAPAAGIAVATAPPAPREAFPEMRALWDRAPAAAPAAATGDEALYARAERNARLAAEAFYRCRRYVDGWLAHADPKTGLIPRNLRDSADLWNGRDSAADNYPFMVLTCALTDRPMFEGRMLEMLRTETKLTSRIDRLCDNYLFSKQRFVTAQPNLDPMMFDNAEYVKDGLIPLTEWLGPSPWSERAVGIIEDVWKHAPVETPFGRIPTLNLEVNGDLLQACARLYWFTGEAKYLDWAIRLGDYYLLGDHHPTRDMKELRLVDHGCEVINGLTELYVAVSAARPEKKAAYREPLHAIFRSILEKGRNADGQLYQWFNPQTGAHAARICDTWGYDYDGFYTMYLVDKTEAYRDAVVQVLSTLKDRYTDYKWGGMDDYNDSIESAINLFNREPLPPVADWIDSQTRILWAMQKPDGVIEGWHGDGNFGRTVIMYALWKTQGVHAEPWRADLRVGAVRDGGRLLVSTAADAPWQGRLVFDRPRHRVNLHLPFDYPRINQFPEWFTVEAGQRFRIAGAPAPAGAGVELAQGLELTLAPGREVRIEAVALPGR